jgi:hypothetical protein
LSTSETASRNASSKEVTRPCASETREGLVHLEVNLDRASFRLGLRPHRRGVPGIRGIQEVQVDAGNGKVLSSESADAKQEAAERKTGVALLV